MPVSAEAIRNFAAHYVDAWNSGHPEQVAACFAQDGGIIINRGEPSEGRAGVTKMAAGFYGDVDDMRVACDELRIAGDHVIFVWTFTGRHAQTGNPLDVQGWEEWDIDGDGLIKSSKGWFDAEEYARQVAGG